jgi:hypothetical protein
VAGSGCGGMGVCGAQRGGMEYIMTLSGFKCNIFFLGHTVWMSN